MKRSKLYFVRTPFGRFTEAQIAFAIKQSEPGTRVREICRKMSISEPTFYTRKKEYGGLGVTELRKLKTARGRKCSAEEVDSRP